jgi:hypothetical protein
MRADRKRRGNCLLMVLAMLALLAGLGMTVGGGMIFVHNSKWAAVHGRAYDRAVAKAQELDRRSGAGGRRDYMMDGQIEIELTSAEIAGDLYREARDNAKTGLALLAGGILTTLVAGGLFVLSMVLRIRRRRAPSTPPATRGVPSQGVSSPEQKPAPSAPPSKPPPTREAAAAPESDVRPRPDSWSEQDPAPTPFWGPVLLVRILASLTVLAGLVLSAGGGAIYVRASDEVGYRQAAYNHAVSETERLRGIGGPRDRTRDLAIEAHEQSADFALGHLQEAKSGQRFGFGLAAGGLVTTIIGAGLFVLLVVLQIRRRAPSTPPAPRDVPPQPVSPPEQKPAPPSPLPPRRDAAATSQSGVPPQPDPLSEHEPAPTPFWGPVLVLVGIVAIVFVLAPLGVYAVIRLASSASPAITEPKEPAAENATPAEPDSRAAADKPAKSQAAEKADPTGPPPAPAPPTDGEQYLRELVATDVNMLDDIDRKFTVRKVPFEHGVYLHPPTSKSSGEASYRLEGGYKRLRGAVGIRDDRVFRRSMSPLTFRLLGDGKELWRSRAALQTAGEWEAFDVDLTGVDQLTLKVDCPGFHTGAHAAWLDPILVRAASGAPVASAKPNPEAAAKADPTGPPPVPAVSVEPAAEDGAPAETGGPDKPTNPVSPRDRLRARIQRRRGRGDVASLPREDYPAPPQAKAPGEGERYLRDLKPAKVYTHIFVKLDRTFKLADVEYQHGVSLCLRFPGRPSHVTYELDKPYSRFRGAAGVSDNKIHGCKSPMTLRILADGAEVWKSERMQHSGDWAPFDIDLTGVRQLQLSVQAEGGIDGGHAVWLDPVLVEQP